MSVVCVLRTPMKEVHRETRGEKWCFVCRRRSEFFYTVRATVEPSYFDPNPDIVCERGHSDGDLFPGYVREWEG